MFFKKDAVISQTGFNTILGKNKKGLGPVVAVALLLVVAVTAVIGFQTWYQSYSSQLFTQSESQGGDLTTGVERVVGETLYFKSNKDNLSVSKIEIGGEDCNFQGSTLRGMSKIDISTCLNSVPPGTSQDIVVYTDEGVYSESFIVGTSQLSAVYTDTFISVWNTSENGISNSNQIVLPLESSGVYNFTVTSQNLLGSPITITSHTNNVLNFTTSGIQEISIQGTISGWRFNNGGDREKLYEIVQWGPLNLGNSGNYFHGAVNLNIRATDLLNLSGTTNFNSIFQMPNSPNTFQVTGSINGWNTSQITSMNLAFMYTDIFNSPISGWNTSSVTSMLATFLAADSFNQPINSWDTSQVTTMQQMFERAISFNQDLNMWDTSSLEFGGLQQTFDGASSFNGDISTWDVSTVGVMYGTFNGAEAFNRPLNSWNVSNVVTTEYMFTDALAFNQDISMWETFNVTSMTRMFFNAQSFNQNLSDWNVSQVGTNCADFNTNTSSWILPKPSLDPSCLS